MTPPTEDVIGRRLAQLALVVPDPRRGARIRGRCHAVLDRRRRRQLKAEARVAFRWTWEVAAVIGLGAVYLSAVVAQAAALYAAP